MARFAMDHLSPLAARRRLDEVDLEEKSRLADGRLTLSNACEIAAVLRKDNSHALLDSAAHQPKWQVRRIVVEAARQKPAARIPIAAALAAAPAQESAAAPAPSAEPSLADQCELSAHDAPLTEAAPARVNRQVRGREFATSAGGRGLRVVLTDEELAN